MIGGADDRRRSFLVNSTIRSISQLVFNRFRRIRKKRQKSFRNEFDSEKMNSNPKRMNSTQKYLGKCSNFFRFSKFRISKDFFSKHSVGPAQFHQLVRFPNRTRFSACSMDRWNLTLFTKRDLGGLLLGRCSLALSGSLPSFWFDLVRSSSFRFDLVNWLVSVSSNWSLFVSNR